jgi:hypothetical protein
MIQVNKTKFVIDAYGAMVKVDDWVVCQRPHRVIKGPNYCTKQVNSGMTKMTLNKVINVSDTGNAVTIRTDDGTLKRVTFFIKAQEDHGPKVEIDENGKQWLNDLEYLWA